MNARSRALGALLVLYGAGHGLAQPESAAPEQATDAAPSASDPIDETRVVEGEEREPGGVDASPAELSPGGSESEEPISAEHSSAVPVDVAADNANSEDGDDVAADAGDEHSAGGSDVESEASELDGDPGHEFELPGLPGASEDEGPDPLGRTSVRAFLASELRVYPVRRSDQTNDQTLWLEGELEVAVELSRGVSLMLRPRFLVDALNTSMRRAEPLEGYLDLHHGGVEFRVGQLVENWGIVDTVNPLDVLNRRDFARDPLGTHRLGELGARFRLAGPGGAHIQEPTFSAYFLPLWRATPLPGPGSRWQVGPSAIASDEYRRPSTGEAVFSALRFEHTVQSRAFGADLSYVVAHGPSRFPLFASVVDAAGNTRIVPEAFGEWVGGGGFRLVPSAPGWSRLTFKSEVAYHHPYAFDDMRTAPEGYLQYVVGIEGQLNEVFSDKAGLTIMLEYAGESLASDELSEFRPFDHDLVLRLFWEANDFARTAVELRAVVDVIHGELIAEAFVGANLRFLHNDLRLEWGARYLRSRRDPPSVLALFTNNSDIRARLQFSF